MYNCIVLEINLILSSREVDMDGVVAETKKFGIEYIFKEHESSNVIEQVSQSLNCLKSLEG